MDHAGHAVGIACAKLVWRGYGVPAGRRSPAFPPAGIAGRRGRLLVQDLLAVSVDHEASARRTAPGRDLRCAGLFQARSQHDLGTPQARDPKRAHPEDEAEVSVDPRPSRQGHGVSLSGRTATRRVDVPEHSWRRGEVHPGEVAIPYPDLPARPFRRSDRAFRLLHAGHGTYLPGRGPARRTDPATFRRVDVSVECPLVGRGRWHLAVHAVDGQKLPRHDGGIRPALRPADRHRGRRQVSGRWR